MNAQAGSRRAAVREQSLPPLGTQEPVGVWIIGARGTVATTALIGPLAVASGLAPRTGFMTEQRVFAEAGLPALQSLVFGGHDLSYEPLGERLEELTRRGVLPRTLPDWLLDELAEVERRVRPGLSAADAAEDPAGSLARLRRDLQQFRRDHQLQHVVVVNACTAQRLPSRHVAELRVDELLDAVAGDGPQLPPDVLYGFAAVTVGCAFVDLSTSVATSVVGLRELALLHRVPLIGRDGKSGWALHQAALARALAERATPRDGGGAADAESRCTSGPPRPRPPDAAEVAFVTDDRPLRKSSTHHVPLGGWAVAERILRPRCGGCEVCESTLAAVTLVDVVRLTAAARRHGSAGPVPALNYFFNDPVQAGDEDLADEFRALVSWARSLSLVAVPS